MMMTTNGFLGASALLLMTSLDGCWPFDSPPDSPPLKPVVVEPAPAPAPPPAPASPCPSPDIEHIKRDDVVVKAMDEAWRRSKEGVKPDSENPKLGEHEESFRVVHRRIREGKSFHYKTVIIWSAPGTVDSTEIKPHSMSGDRVVADFHTHPGPNLDLKIKGNDRFDNSKASPHDIAAQEQSGVPMVIRYGTGPEPGVGKTFEIFVPLKTDKTGQKTDKPTLKRARRLSWECPNTPPPEGGLPPEGPPSEEPPPGGPPSCSGCARVTGDPHFVTHDGRAFDLQSAGEFVTVAVDGASRMQLRTQPASGARLVSINTAVGMRVGTARVSIRPREGLFVDGAAVALTPSSVGIARQSTLAQVGDTPTVREPVPLALTGGGSVVRHGEDYVVDWPDGSRAWVQVLERSLDVFFAASDSLRGRTSGLLGNHDGASDNDFQLRDGTALGAPDHAALHGRFADSWRVGPGESLFDYGPGETTETFTDRTMPAAPATLESLDAAARLAAAKTCADAGITDPVALAECTLDIALAGDLAFIRSAQAVQTLPDPRPGLHPTNAPPATAAGSGTGGQAYRVRYTGGEGGVLAFTISVDPPRHAMIQSGVRVVFDGQRAVSCTGEAEAEQCWTTDDQTALKQFGGFGLVESPDVVRAWLTVPSSTAERHEARTIIGRRAACRIVGVPGFEMSTCHDVETGVLLAARTVAGGESMLDITAVEFAAPRPADFATPDVKVLPAGL